MARGFDDIQPQQSRGASRSPLLVEDNENGLRDYFQQWNPNRGSFISDTFYKCLENKFVTKHGRGVEFRPSSFPQCPIINYLKKVWYDELGYNIDERSATMDYYCDVGTVVHETVQFHMGDSGVQHGHYRCINPKCKHGKAGQNTLDAAGNITKAGKLTRKNTVKNRCPKCKERMFYEELTVKYRGIKGHVDGVIKMPDGRYWIIDYKTSSMKKIMKGSYPEKKHLYQLPVYAYILGKKYGFEIAGFSLIYIPRDMPFAFYEYAEKWSKKWTKHSLGIIRTQKYQWEAFQKTLETGDLDHIIEAKPCSCEAEYKKKMWGGFDHCPMKDICFSPRLKPALQKWNKLCKKQKVKDARLDQAVAVITDKQLREKKKKSIGLGIKRKGMGTMKAS